MQTATVSTRQAGAARVMDEYPIPVSQAATLIPANTHTGHASVTTLLRWIIRGKRGVRLDAAKIKGVWHTSLAAIERFRNASREAERLANNRHRPMSA